MAPTSHIDGYSRIGLAYLLDIPDLLGGLAALVFVGGIDRGAQGLGIVITAVVAVVTGLLAGRILALTGHRNRPYDDSEEFPG